MNFLYLPFLLVTQDEERISRALVVIVVFFMVCNVPTAISHFEELLAILPTYYRVMFKGEMRIQKESNPCYSPPFWAHIILSIAKLFLTMNASAGCFLYCLMCQAFRAKLSNQFHRAVNFVRVKACYL